MLETEIKKLTEAVRAAVELMEQIKAESQATTPASSEAESQATTPASSEAESQAPTPSETPSEENEQGVYDVDDIKSMALAIARKDRSKRDEIKAKLAEYDAKVATDLSGDALQIVGRWLAELVAEVGA